MTTASMTAAEFRAAGTDLSERRRSGVSQGPLIDIFGAPDTVGIGEVATVPTSPALANAIRNATGIRLTEIPIRPDRLIAALKGRAAA